MTELELPGRKNREESLQNFADKLQDISGEIGFSVSARGWCYQLELEGLITKAEFDKVENVINECRRKGILPIDFTAEEEGRKFSGVELPQSESPLEFLRGYIESPLNCQEWYTPDWWEGEKYYVHMLVEKIDLKTLFTPECEPNHIPIATSKGWSSMLQRAEYARRFKEGEENGLIGVLLYCGDHDPDGLRIGEFLRKNLEDLAYIEWEDGTEGYDPSDLIIERFGLDYDFIIDNNLTWIDNLITGSGRNLASPSHKNYHMPYVQSYLARFGARKCEANALVVRPDQGRELCRNKIINGGDEWDGLGTEALGRFAKRRQAVRDTMADIRERTGLDKAINDALKLIEDEED